MDVHAIEAGIIERSNKDIQEMVAREVALRNQVNQELWEDFFTYPEDAEDDVLDMDTVDGVVYERTDFGTMQQASEFLRRKSSNLLSQQFTNSIIDRMAV